MSFKLTYATMFNPPEDMHARFEAALTKVTASLDARHELFVNGADVPAAAHVARHSPIDLERTLGDFAVASRADVDDAMKAAQTAFPGWRAMPAPERARLMRRVADMMEQRVYEIAAALSLEVGKNRMEALGEAQETVDFFRHYADDFEGHAGYEHELPNDPLPNVVSRNRSVMRPYGVWVVIAPFNFPLALAGGPVAAALVIPLPRALEDRLVARVVRSSSVPPGEVEEVSRA
jgi:1-pyrroline-5-carboxylate dehydrogenase